MIKNLRHVSSLSQNYKLKNPLPGFSTKTKLFNNLVAGHSLKTEIHFHGTTKLTTSRSPMLKTKSVLEKLLRTIKALFKNARRRVAAQPITIMMPKSTTTMEK